MFNKIYAFLKENRKEIIIFILLLILFNIRFPYYIESPGGTLSLADRMKIENSHLNGDVSLVFVAERPATIPTLTWAFISKDWDIIEKEEVVLSNETVDESDERGRIDFNQSFNNALIYAFNKAGKEIKIKSKDFYVTYIYPDAQTDLKVGDKILYIGDTKIEEKSDFSALTDAHEVGDEITIKVLSNNKEVTRKAKLIDLDRKKKIGILAATIYDYETPTEIKFEAKRDEMGSSGGLANTLYIYSSLIDEDLIKGRKIVATGTIDDEGNVGEIGGIKYKMKSAAKSDGDMFFVPERNCEDALKIKKENKYKIDVACVSTFDEVLTYLKK